MNTESKQLPEYIYINSKSLEQNNIENLDELYEVILSDKIIKSTDELDTLLISNLRHIDLDSLYEKASRLGYLKNYSTLENYISSLRHMRSIVQ